MTEAQKRWRREHPERIKAAQKKYQDAHRGERPKARPMICKVCGKAFSHAWRKTCSDECKNRISSVTMKSTNQKYASVRMRTNNPMHRGDARERMIATLHKIGHKPKIRGGNGKPIPKPVSQLRALLPDFEYEVVILTGKQRGCGYPPAYKVDLGNTLRKVAVEVDGFSHTTIARRQQDRKKDELLSALGWTVLRFSNEEAAAHTEECANLIRSAMEC